jgi:threonylcarbamoyladenosine tRNA methylthiotransferase MtaB
MVVTGCYARTLSNSPLKGGNIIFVDAKHKGDIPKLIEEALNLKVSPLRGDSEGSRSFVPACACGERTRFFLKVQDGCDYFCTYCKIPFARGRSRNGSIASLVKQAEEAAQQGGKEIVLTGVNIGDFGKTTGEKFINLLRALDKVEGIERYRISSIEPNLLTEEIIRFCSESRAFMPHFHIPLQSGSDEVLRLMHRRYDTKFFAEKIDEVRRYIPDAFIGVDVIVGMRGETDEQFAKAYEFLKALPVSQYHVFSYSERPGTKALEIPGKVTPQKKHERSRQIQSLSDEKLHIHYNIYKGQTRPVLLEHNRKGGPLHGFTDNYIRIEVSPLRGDLEGSIVPICLGEWNEKGDALMGEIVNCKL